MQQIQIVSAYHSDCPDVPVVVTVRELRRNATFNPIRDGIVQLARASIAQGERAVIEDQDEDDDLSAYQEYGSDDDEPPLHKAEHDKVILPGYDAIIPEFMLDRFIFGPQEFEQIG